MLTGQENEFLERVRADLEPPRASLLSFLRAKPGPLEGWRLGDLQVGELLGQGATGLVFAAEKEGRAYALKLLPRPGGEADREQAAFFEREMRICQRLVHENIVRFFEFRELPSARLVLMEKVEGQSLASVLEAGPLEGRAFRTVFGSIASALDYAHQQSVVHRDLKPENVMMGGDMAVKILDFGLARARQEGVLTVTGEFKGTPLYSSPEQVKSSRQVTAASDQFAFGLMAFEGLAGTLPFEENPKQPLMTLFARLETPARRLREVAPAFSAETEEVLARMLAIEPEERFPSVSDAYQALEQTLGLSPEA